jgi:hypothetical protein
MSQSNREQFDAELSEPPEGSDQVYSAQQIFDMERARSWATQLGSDVVVAP